MTKNSMYFVWVGTLALAFAVLGSALSAQEQQGEIIRVIDRGDADKAAAPLRVTMPGPVDATAPVPEEETMLPPPEPEAPPPVEEPKDEPPVEDEDPPTFFGEPVTGNVVFVLDRSGSMKDRDSGSGPLEDWNGNTVGKPDRITIVKSECIKVLRELTEENKFAIITFGAWPNWTWYDAMVPGTPPNVEGAIAEVLEMRAAGWTPAGRALKKACSQYEAEPDRIFFLCDGQPYGPGGDAAGILANFPGWFKKLKAKPCKLVCVHVGNDASSAQFMRDLANQNGGEYVKK